MKTSRNNSANRVANFEQEIDSIFRGLEANLEDDSMVVRERPSKNSAFCKGLISVYNKHDLERMKNERAFKARPIKTYAFYPNTMHPSKIGSVAIYGEKAFNWCLTLNKRGILFGKKILSAKLEMGLRPFVDVKLVA